MLKTFYTLKVFALKRLKDKQIHVCHKSTVAENSIDAPPILDHFWCLIKLLSIPLLYTVVLLIFQLCKHTLMLFASFFCTFFNGFLLSHCLQLLLPLQQRQLSFFLALKGNGNSTDKKNVLKVWSTPSFKALKT